MDEVLPIHPRNQPLSERLRASEAEAAILKYEMEAVKSSLSRLWAAYADLEEHYMINNPKFIVD